MGAVVVVIIILVCIGVCLIGYFLQDIIVTYIKHQYFAGIPSKFYDPFQVYKVLPNERIPPYTSTILKHGDVLLRDFRKNTKSMTSPSKINRGKTDTFDISFDDNLNPTDITSLEIRELNSSVNTPKIRVLSINIEMGKQINNIISTLKNINADIIILQEVNINVLRNGYVDSLAEIATALNMNSMFCCEVVFPPAYMLRNMVIPKGEKEVVIEQYRKITGYEGNALLTKYDILYHTGIITDCVRLYKHNKHSHRVHNEGFAILDTPIGYININFAHFDLAFCGIDKRIEQYEDILKTALSLQEDARNYLNIGNRKIFTIFGGDFNTVCNGLNRFQPRIACTWKSFSSLGMQESEYFQEYGVKKMNKKYNIDLWDPFDKDEKGATFISVNNLFKAKADWLLFDKDIKCSKKHIATQTELCSDHCWIYCDIHL